MPMKQNNTHMISPKLNVDDVSYGLLVAMFYLVKNNLILLAFSDTRFQKSRRARVRTTQTGRSIAVALTPKTRRDILQKAFPMAN